jgi:hypothetical protein
MRGVSRVSSFAGVVVALIGRHFGNGSRNCLTWSPLHIAFDPIGPGEIQRKLPHYGAWGAMGVYK